MSYWHLLNFRQFHIAHSHTIRYDRKLSCSIHLIIYVVYVYYSCSQRIKTRKLLAIPTKHTIRIENGIISRVFTMDNICHLFPHIFIILSWFYYDETKENNATQISLYTYTYRTYHTAYRIHRMLRSLRSGQSGQVIYSFTDI